MKKITFFLTLPLLCAASNISAAADKYQYTPYIGIDYAYNQTNAKGFSPRYNALGLHIGSDYSADFGTEIFYNQSAADKRRPNNEKIKTSYRSYGLDLLAYLPLGCQKQLALLATTGMGEYVFNHKKVPQKHHNEHGYGYRFGGGFKYALNQNWQMRFITRYVKFNHADAFNHATEYTLSAEYHF